MVRLVARSAVITQFTCSAVRLTLPAAEREIAVGKALIDELHDLREIADVAGARAANVFDPASVDDCLADDLARFGPDPEHENLGVGFSHSKVSPHPGTSSCRDAVIRRA